MKGDAFEYEFVVTLKDINPYGSVYFSRYFEWQGICRELYLITLNNYQEVLKVPCDFRCFVEFLVLFCALVVCQLEYQCFFARPFLITLPLAFQAKQPRFRILGWRIGPGSICRCMSDQPSFFCSKTM